MIKKIANTFRISAPFIEHYGLIKGIELIVKYKRRNAATIKLPDIAHPITLRPHTSDIQVFHQIFINKEYDITLDHAPVYIIDGGANIGLFAIYIKNRFPDAKIICVEPDPENFKLLQQNMAPYKDVHCEQYGIWDKDTKLKVYDKFDAGKWGIVVEEDAVGGTINSVTIDTLIRKYNLPQVDLLKLDIETSEKKVFAAAEQNWLQNTKTLLIELHDWLEPGCSKTFFEALNHCGREYAYSANGENVIISF
jgi:FkbM family methyltransferase